jgi:hypothetical protein
MNYIDAYTILFVVLSGVVGAALALAARRLP